MEGSGSATEYTKNTLCVVMSILQRDAYTLQLGKGIKSACKSEHTLLKLSMKSHLSI